jgi:hypothetical protein
MGNANSLRQTFVTLLAERGRLLPVIMSLVSARMTRHQTPLSANAARDAVERLALPHFVDEFVDDSKIAGCDARKLLN